MMKEIGMSIPDFFICPISLELFSDPVTLCTGQTYDRPSIERWLASGNLTCPVTMQQLHDISMVPNHTLRHLIDQWLHKGNTISHHDDDHGFYNVGPKIMFYTSLKNVLESQNSALEQKIQILEQIICLSKDLHRKNEGLIQMGFFSLIMGIIFESKNTQLETMVLVEKSLNCALKLVPFSSLSDLNMLLEEQNFETFKILLHEGSNFVKVALCNIIEIVSLSKEYNLSTKIENDTKIIQSLLGYINNYPQNSELSEAGVKAILSLLTSSSSSLEKRRENLIKEGLIESMVTYILEAGVKKNKDEVLLIKVIKALEKILDDSESAKRGFMVNGVLSRGIKALIKMVFRVSGDDEGSESAVNCLMRLCDESMIAREEAIYGGILTQLLLLLQSQCSTRTKTRARMLLKLLRTMWPMDPKQL